MSTERMSAPVAFAVLLAMSAGAASSATFDIQVNFNGGLTASQQAIFTTAETYWESVITGYQEDPGPFAPPLTITATGANIDGVGGILGSAGSSSGVATSSFLYATAGAMTFDTADLGALETAGTLLDVILHEMAHVIGFGTLWSSSGRGVPGYQELYVNGSGQYTGAFALAAYQAECDAGATFVPVELTGGSGTANAHWDENNFCSGGAHNPELMTGYLDAPTYVSNTTIASFADLGYTTTVTHPTPPVPAPSSVVLTASGLGLLGFVGRRRRRKAKA